MSVSRVVIGNVVPAPAPSSMNRRAVNGALSSGGGGGSGNACAAASSSSFAQRFPPAGFLISIRSVIGDRWEARSSGAGGVGAGASGGRAKGQPQWKQK